MGDVNSIVSMSLLLFLTQNVFHVSNVTFLHLKMFFSEMRSISWTLDKVSNFFKYTAEVLKRTYRGVF